MPLKGGDRHGNYLTGYITGNQTFSIPLGAATRLQMGFYYRQSVLFCCFLKIRFTRRNHEIFPFGISDFGKLVGCFFVFLRKSAFIQSSPREMLSSPNIPIMQDSKGGFTHRLPDINPFNYSGSFFHGNTPECVLCNTSYVLQL